MRKLVDPKREELNDQYTSPNIIQLSNQEERDMGDRRGA